jgi:hypothetical protein
MGVDIYGKKPRSPAGEYFRTNWTGWRPIAEFCQHVAPDVTLGCEHWDSNDGDGLAAADSIKLAKILDREITSGGAKAFADKIAARDDNRRVYVELDDDRGAWVDILPLNRERFLDNTREFAGFLRACGGFEIW